MAHADHGFSDSIDGLIEKITRWYRSDERGFRTLYDAAVGHVVPYPEDTPEHVRCDWRGRDLAFLCDFLRDWYAWGRTAKPTEGLDYIRKFNWLTHKNDYGMVFVTCGAGRDMTAEFTHLQGRQMDAPESKRLVDIWKRELGSRMDDFEKGPWPDFNAFFTRELRPGRRPVDKPDDNSVVVAPTDCVISMVVDELTEDTPIPVKTVTMNVRQLLDGSEHYRKFVPGQDERGRAVPGGTAVSCVLMPDTYHWYHAPVAGEVVEATDGIGGVHYGMRDFPGLLNRGNVGHGFGYATFEDFRRGYVVIRTRFRDPRGREHETYVGMVTVGLNSIASVNYLPRFQEPAKPVRVRKGEKIGNFRYGGSLVILLFQHGRFPALQLHMGQRIGNLECGERSAALFTGSHRHQALRRLLLSL
ncbi:phosphatidylserine decarboxylase [Streptomyces marincola]|uniref:phosphatidylserine decarboxylase n=1 Tax=Streptomyces marincola TaxID=2878388 RepID=UPI0021003642|nr:phosphatidylserine decarboxylase [Streptomyces marincola]